MGLSSGIYFIAANPLVSELFPDNVGAAIGVHGLSSQVAAVTVPLGISVVLIDGNWRSIFLIIAGIAATATAALIWAARRTDLPEAGTADRSLGAATRAQWPTILTGIAFVGAAGFLWNGLFNLYGDYLTVAKAIDAETGRLMLSVMFAAGLPAFVVTGWLADRVPNVPLLLIISSGFVVAVGGLTLVDGIAAIVAASLVIGYTFHSLLTAVDTYMLSSLPDRHRASAYAVFSAVMMGVQAFGSGVVGTAVAGGLAYTTVFQLLTVGVGAMLVLLFGLYRVGRLPAGGRTGPVPAPERAD
ncbi:MAG: arabinose efflux permease [halophilic archaeon J07HX5]|nr:MAG: arabinose efflux permease [halophilic archaeon J07HX5]